MKNILVCMKAVPVSSAVEVDGQHRLKRDSTNLQWNIADASALEAALQLVDRDGCVTVLTMGPHKLTQALPELIARGATGTVLISDRLMAGADTRATATALAAAARMLGVFDGIFCGSKAVDGETGQVPGALAAALNLPCISNVEKVESCSGRLILSRRLENGIQELECAAPAVVSFLSYSYPLRLAGILGMRRARTVPVTVLTAANLRLSPEDCGLQGSLTKVIAMEAKFPGLRRGPKETDTDVGTEILKGLLREVQP